MGSSKAYAGFMGFVEILSGILLFFKKTRFIGGYLAFGVFANVLAINVGFDITVKLLSLGLLLSSVFIIAPSVKPLVQLLSSQTVSRISIETIEINPVLYRTMKSFTVTLIVLECLWPIIDRSHYEFNPKAINHQSFDILQTEKCPEGIPYQEYRRLHFHPHGYLILESFDGKFQSYDIHIPPGANQFKLQNGTSVRAIRRDREWIFVDGNQLLWRCKRLPNEESALLKDEFHWTVESMIPE